VLADITSTQFHNDFVGPPPKAIPCEFDGSSAFLAGRPVAVLLDADGMKLGRSRLSWPHVGVGGFCETFADFPNVPASGKYRVAIGQRIAELDGEGGDRIDGADDGQGTPLAWDLGPDDFR
jgi:hypothetical protein